MRRKKHWAEKLWEGVVMVLVRTGFALLVLLYVALVFFSFVLLVWLATWLIAGKPTP